MRALVHALRAIVRAIVRALVRALELVTRAERRQGEMTAAGGSGRVVLPESGGTKTADLADHEKTSTNGSGTGVRCQSGGKGPPESGRPSAAMERGDEVRLPESGSRKLAAQRASECEQLARPPTYSWGRRPRECPRCQGIGWLFDGSGRTIEYVVGLCQRCAGSGIAPVDRDPDRGARHSLTRR